MFTTDTGAVVLGPYSTNVTGSSPTGNGQSLCMELACSAHVCVFPPSPGVNVSVNGCLYLYY